SPFPLPFHPNSTAPYFPFTTLFRSWNRVQIARHQMRPTTLDYVDHLFTDFLEFHGDRYFGDDEAIVAGIGFYHDKPITIIGHQRDRKSTRLNSSHVSTSYAVFCLKT